MKKINPDITNQHWQPTEAISSDRFNEQISHDLMLLAYRRTEEIFREDMRGLISDIERVTLQG